MKLRDLLNKASAQTPWLMIVLLLIINVLLVMQNLKLRAEVNSFKPNVLQPGERVNSFSSQGLHGESINITYTGKEVPRLLLYFNSNCPYCQEQFFYWRQILNKINANHFRIIGVVSDSEDRTRVEEYLRSVDCESLTIAFVPSDVRRDYKLSVTPTTLLIDNNGSIKNAWIGKWNTDIAYSAGAVLGLQFSEH